MINANEAKSLSTKMATARKINILQYLYSRIKQVAERGEFEYVYGGNILDSVESELKTNGYKIERPNNIYLIISWSV